MAAVLLVVEDNIDNRELIEHLLKAFGYRPVLASGGREGIRLARETQPDLILMDLQMPEVDGYEARQTIVGDPDLAGTKIIAITALAMVGDRERILDAGFDGYISKPISPATFVEEVEAYLPSHLHANGANSSVAR
jgi:CheY-like chemotaxis protein